MKKDVVRFCAVGDSFLIEHPSRSDEELATLRAYISESDVAVTNVEANLHHFEADVYPAGESGGDWAVASPEVLDALKWMGFNLFSAPNNHSLDFLQGGVMHTIQAFRNANACFAGIGENLAAAEAPAYISVPGGRVALIALNLSFEKWHVAGEQRRDCQGRPGINYVCHDDLYGVSGEVFSALMDIVKTYPGLGKIDGKEIQICGKVFVEGDGVCTRARRKDVERIQRSIRRAKKQADVVLVSVHSHENRNGDPAKPAQFEEALAHACIDAGADAYIGHGPHVVRGIEVYRDRPILYSLGNFFYQCELIERSPEEFYHKFSEFDQTACTADVFDYREQNGGMLGELNPEYYRSMMATFAMSLDGKLESLEIHPIDLVFKAKRSRKGTPRLAEGTVAEAVFAEVVDRSAAYGTHFEQKDNKLILKLKLGEDNTEKP